ncbi:MAG TPA: hypothetical protein VJS18_15210 [Paraburkholderia sp.]|nr:hypothetical protein [Paraburkholderia sp.]
MNEQAAESSPHCSVVEGTQYAREVASQQLTAANCFHRVRWPEKYNEERLV